MAYPLFSDSERANRIDRQAFKRLILMYVLAVFTIALIIFISERYLQLQLNRQLYDSKVVNLAGRQRMYSQKITKDLLLLSQPAFASNQHQLITDLRLSLQNWDRTHYALIHGDSSLQIPINNDELIGLKLDSLTKVQVDISDLAKNAILLIEKPEKDWQEKLVSLIMQVHQLEEVYLLHMNEIVALFEKLAKRKVERAKNIQTLLLLISLGILFFEVLFIFRPIAIYVRKQLRKLLHSEWMLNRNVQKSEGLQRSLRASNDDLKTVYFALEEAALFARASSNGDIYYISDHFLEKLHFNKKEQFKYNLFKIIDIKDWTKQLETSKDKNSIWKSELKIRTYNNGHLWIDACVVPVFNNEYELQDLLIICNDITNRKWAEQKVYQLNKERYLRKTAEQKENSIRVIEALEGERKRISRDIHDGLGQLLTAIKFNLQSVNIDQPKKATEKLDYIKDRLAEIIQETRKISFNLTPSNLEDYGVFSALKALAAQVNKQTGIEVKFVNQFQSPVRLPKNLEVNIYRISQEAINNAVKHGNPRLITIKLKSVESSLNITICDNGNGFNIKKLWKDNKQYAAASGILNMKERVNFFDGNFDLETSPNHGTKVSITLPLVNAMSV